MINSGKLWFQRVIDYRSGFVIVLAVQIPCTVFLNISWNINSPVNCSGIDCSAIELIITILELLLFYLIFTF